MNKNGQVFSRFDALLKQEVEKRTKGNARDQFLLDHKDSIEHARSLGIGYVKIAEFLTEAGIKTQGLHIKQFCVKHLGEAPRKRKKTKKSSETAMLVNVKSGVPAIAKTEPKLDTRTRASKSNFRSATEDEDL